MEQKNAICSPYGFEIRENSTYEVQEKYDSSAIDGFKNYRTSKLLTEGNKDIYSGAIFDSDKEIWDTGLFIGSRAFTNAFAGAGLDDKGLKNILTKLQDKIVRPFEKLKGENKLDHIPSDQTDNFWLNYKIEVGRGTIFDTSKPVDLLNLYLLIIFRKLTPKDLESHPDFKQPISYYTIVDKDFSLSKTAQYEMDNLKAVSNFGYMLVNDKEKIISILEYLAMPVGENTPNETLLMRFKDYIGNNETKYTNIKIFNETLDFAATQKGQEIINIYKNLKKLKSKNKVKIIKDQVYLDDTYVDIGFKNSANTIYDNAELRELYDSLIEGIF